MLIDPEIQIVGNRGNQRNVARHSILGNNGFRYFARFASNGMGDACCMKMLCHKSIFFAMLFMGWLLLPGIVSAGEATSQGFPVRAATPIQAAQVVPAAQEINTINSFENQPFNFNNNPRRTPRPATNKSEAYSLPSIWPALLSVVAICGLFVAAMFLVKKYLPGHKQLFSHPSMEVLGRTHLDQRRYVSLLRVGKRIIVLGISPDEISSLSEITDEEEITGIMEVARPKTEVGLSIFQRLFQRHVIEADKAENQAMAMEQAKEIEEHMSSLRERVRSIHAEESPKRHVDAIG